MQTGDWVQSIVGAVGILATLVVAWMVRGLEKKDRQTEKSETERREEQRRREEQQREEQRRREEQQREEQRRREEQQREKRLLRREQHKEDYRAAMEALDDLLALFNDIEREPKTDEELTKAGLERAATVLERVGSRVESLDITLHMVALHARDVSFHAFPSAREMKSALSPTDKDELAKGVASYVKDAVRHGVGQHAAAREGQRAIEKAREAIGREWGN